MWLLHSNSILGSGEIQYHKKKLFQVNEKLIFFFYLLFVLLRKQTADFNVR